MSRLNVVQRLDTYITYSGIELNAAIVPHDVHHILLLNIFVYSDEEGVVDE
jgi:hypothetical protein